MLNLFRLTCFVMRMPACWSWFFELYWISVCVDCCGLLTIVIRTIIISIIIIINSFWCYRYGLFVVLRCKCSETFCAAESTQQSTDRRRSSRNVQPKALPPIRHSTMSNATTEVPSTSVSHIIWLIMHVVMSSEHMLFSAVVNTYWLFTELYVRNSVEV